MMVNLSLNIYSYRCVNATPAVNELIYSDCPITNCVSKDSALEL